MIRLSFEPVKSDVEHSFLWTVPRPIRKMRMILSILATGDEPSNVLLELPGDRDILDRCYIVVLVKPVCEN